MAEEVLRSIRTVVAFGGEGKEFGRYSTRLQEAQKAGKRKGIFSGIGEGILRFFFYVCNAIAFWYGVSLILDDRDKPPEEKEYTPAVLMIVSRNPIFSSSQISNPNYFPISFSRPSSESLWELRI